MQIWNGNRPVQVRKAKIALPSTFCSGWVKPMWAKVASQVSDTVTKTAPYYLKVPENSEHFYPHGFYNNSHPTFLG